PGDASRNHVEPSLLSWRPSASGSGGSPPDSARARMSPAARRSGSSAREQPPAGFLPNRPHEGHAPQQTVRPPPPQFPGGILRARTPRGYARPARRPKNLLRPQTKRPRGEDTLSPDGDDP